MKNHQLPLCVKGYLGLLIEISFTDCRKRGEGKVGTGCGKVSVWASKLQERLLKNVGFKEHVAPVKRNDLLSVCKKGKLKEAIELLGQGEVADPGCFRVLFGFCRKLKKLEEAKKGFDHMGERNMDTWHLIINGYAGNGLGDDGLEMYERMRNNGLPPNEETFLVVLDSCDGYYGKPGYLAEALEYIQTLPFEPTAEIWETMINYARIHGDIDLEDRCEEILISLDPSKVDPRKSQHHFLKITLLSVCSRHVVVFIYQSALLIGLYISLAASKWNLWSSVPNCVQMEYLVIGAKVSHDSLSDLIQLDIPVFYRRYFYASQPLMNPISRAPNRCSSSIGKTRGVVIVHSRNRLGRLDHGLTEF
ncbi:pentatricopeptide repeat-containing protein [Tanacetum coccineum]